jgi:hypothetical protein
LGSGNLDVYYRSLTYIIHGVCQAGEKILIQRRISKLEKRLMKSAGEMQVAATLRFGSIGAIENEIQVALDMLVSGSSVPVRASRQLGLKLSWHCGQCTFINRDGDKCEMCGQARPDSVAKTITTAGTQDRPVDLADGDGSDEDDDFITSASAKPQDAGKTVIGDLVASSEADVLLTTVKSLGTYYSQLIDAKPFRMSSDDETDLLCPSPYSQTIDQSDDILRADEYIMLSLQPNESAHAAAQKISMSIRNVSGRAGAESFEPPCFTVRGKRFFANSGRQQPKTPGKSRFFGGQ